MVGNLVKKDGFIGAVVALTPTYITLEGKDDMVTLPLEGEIEILDVAFDPYVNCKINYGIESSEPVIVCKSS